MRYHAAEWRKSPNYNEGGNEPRIVVVHIMQGTLAGTDSWFHNTESEVSAHFGTGRDGRVYQWVDTDNRAWHAANANSYSIGIENEGDSGQTLTHAQIEAVGKILAWAHKHYPAIDLWLNKRVSGSGLSYHALGGASWGGHPNCPGTPIIEQLPHILQVAKDVL
jgi:N-acetyl-anhydromuramyl-L-alanine amidase AmpD